MPGQNPKIVDAYDQYGDFILSQYFALLHDQAPSKLSLWLTIEGGKQVAEQCLRLIDREQYQLTQLRKRWSLSTTREDVPENDEIRGLTLVSHRAPLCLELTLNEGEFGVDVYYGHTHEGLEQWVRKQLTTIRDEFGRSDLPVFSILTRTRGGFDTEKVDIDRFDLDLAANYNDDFLPVDQDIRRSIEDRNSGLVLLHGIPGTGKTSYIKSLMTDYAESKFIFIPNDFVNDLLKPEFVTFLIRQKNAILVIEDAEKIIVSRDNVSQHSVVSTILQLTDGLFSDYLNIKVICTFNTDVSRVDKALFRKGRLIAFYEFRALSLDKTRALLGENGYRVTEGLTLAEIYNFGEPGYSDADAKPRIGFAR
ncbi:AAA family ATPase [Lewinella sp. W8]|uniref:AAA family ATPase n=1 Tax=Lewinella sp. W8 TaxID=2528208 RepID=UPI00106757E8|nr:AAA family ATPase [Lewinella sp. W8]MTB52319.1 AAA family ATPase [Lewinella sp. W8]